MSQASTLKIRNIGPVLFERSSRAKRLNISIRPFKGVRVAVPRGMSLKRAECTVQEKLNWIRKNLAAMQAMEREYRASLASRVEIDREEARKTLADRLAALAEQHGFRYNRVTIRNQRTRWGSCSHKNNISLNVKLLLLPEELRDFILVHELVHTKVKNHGKRFWALLTEIEPDARLLATRINRYNITLL